MSTSDSVWHFGMEAWWNSLITVKKEILEQEGIVFYGLLIMITCVYIYSRSDAASKVFA